MKIYSGSGIIPIIKDKNNNYYLVLFKSTIRRTISDILIEDAGGQYEGDNIILSAIRELKEESSSLFDLKRFTNQKQIKNLYNAMKNNKIKIKLFDNKYYASYFVYLDGVFDLEKLRKEYISNLRSFWKFGFSVYTENRDIIFIPINNLKKINSTYVQDYLGKEYMLFSRTYCILNKLIKLNIKEFIKNMLKYSIILNKNIVNTFNYNYKNENYHLNNLIVYY